MRVSNLFFYLFTVTFFVFVIIFIVFQYNVMTEGEGGTYGWMMRLYLLLDIVSFLILFTCINRGYGGIHLVCLLWTMIMPMVMFLNSGGIADIVRTMLWPVLFETTYICCQDYSSRSISLKKMYVIIAIIGGAFFLSARFGSDHQTNTIYFCFLTLPWIIYNTDRRTTGVIILLFTFLALLSMKRSTMLSMVLVWGFFFLVEMKSRRKKIVSVLVIVILLAGVYIAYDKVDNMTGGYLTERINREETDGGRDRMAIWELTISMIQRSSTFDLFTGHGHYGVKQNSLLDLSAHNDFLEVIYDYGLVIFLLYLFLCGHIIKRTYKLYKVGSPLFMPYAASISIFFCLSMVSHLILYANYFNYLVMFWGMSEAYVEEKCPELLNQ